jgi:hypothetical protein
VILSREREREASFSHNMTLGGAAAMDVGAAVGTELNTVVQRMMMMMMTLSTCREPGVVV